MGKNNATHYLENIASTAQLKANRAAKSKSLALPRLRHPRHCATVGVSPGSKYIRKKYKAAEAAVAEIR